MNKVTIMERDTSIITGKVNECLAASVKKAFAREYTIGCSRQMEQLAFPRKANPVYIISDKIKFDL